jgi:hypothetical protein
MMQSIEFGGHISCVFCCSVQLVIYTSHIIIMLARKLCYIKYSVCACKILVWPLNYMDSIKPTR